MEKQGRVGGADLGVWWGVWWSRRVRKNEKMKRNKRGRTKSAVRSKEGRE